MNKQLNLFTYFLYFLTKYYKTLLRNGEEKEKKDEEEALKTVAARNKHSKPNICFNTSSSSNYQKLSENIFDNHDERLY